MKMSESDWQAEEDARVLAEYQGILDDKKRMKKAVAVAKKRAAEMQKLADAMSKVSNLGK